MEVKDVKIEESLQESYLDYSMSVIVGRALPDARDGLKPVHRRILYAMHELGLSARVPYKKSARIVGDVIGKYHPHGDSAVYEALVRMAQDFSMRLPLVDGQGNFGSIDGDNAAAMRYTEARMASASEELLRDIEKQTVDFSDNYDSTLKEPDILPSRLPNLLINGSSGIAVGMATSIPPHRLDEIVDALICVLENPQVELLEILDIVQGPDFPTGGVIYGKAGILEAYSTGRGRIKVRAKTRFEKTGSRESIIIEEIPYQTNKAKLVEQISELAKEKIVEGIAEVRDESDREGVRVVIDLKKDAVAQIVLNHLYKSSNMESTFSMIMLAIYNKEPRIFTLLELLKLFLLHRKTIVIRRTIFELEKARARVHILEGLLVALQNSEAVIALIKGSADTLGAKEALAKAHDLSEEQSKAILEMRLQRLTGLEQEKIQQEHTELQEQIAYLQGILEHADKLNALIKEELLEIKEKFSTPRKTQIEEDYEGLSAEDLIAHEDMVVTVSHRGYVKRMPLRVYEQQKRGGKGKISGNTHEDDFIEFFFSANTHDTILFVTNMGQLYWLKVYRIPEMGRNAIGKALVNLIDLQPGERIKATLATKDFSPDKSLVFFTKKGLIKRTNLSAFGRVRGGVRAIVLDEDDALVTAQILSSNTQELFMASSKGLCIRFGIEEVRQIGRVARGVIGMRLRAGDEVIGGGVISSEQEKLLSVSSKGMGKQTLAGAYRLQGRGGMGVIAMKITPKTGDLVGIVSVDESQDLMLLTKSGKMIRMPMDSIRETGRNASGVKLVSVEGDGVVYTNTCPKENEVE
ncbi:DNA gyrase subunit A [Helicobacter heilmannii]|uniref:DNA gyrase subunit A n=1 Tax=Helicobacter heilmannii TaxID=35817 RepID=A0A0K2Y820_HELHE|nr:DNA gyrase subunit A [Helicobacter heilmannii]CCM12098.1 DNA gyrase subunit A [Helicobacter heilmannii ASB1.4]CRI34272.1 DNA gyrase subunit A [Helicobacter heilmannii]